MSLGNKTDPDWVVLGNDAGPAGLQRSRSASPLTWHPESFSIMCWLIDTPEEWFKDLIIQLAGYQPTRHFLHGFTVRDNRMELWMFGRSEPFSSFKFGIQEHPKQFIRVITGYATIGFRDARFGPQGALDEDAKSQRNM